MKKLIILLLFFGYQFSFAQFNFERSWGTYLSDAQLVTEKHVVDSNGNMYFFFNRGISNQNGLTFITANAFQTSYSTSKIFKINKEGDIVWGTYINVEIIDIKIDKSNDDIIILGYPLQGSSNLISQNAFETEIVSAPLLLTKFDANGNKLWGTYYNVGFDNTNIGATSPSLALDHNGNIYFSHRAGYATLGTNGTFQMVKNGANPFAISKFSPNGMKIWTTYYGINGSRISEISINDSGLFIRGFVKDCAPQYSNPNTYFATLGSYQPTSLGNCSTSYLSKFNFDGQRLWSTYFKFLGDIKAIANEVYVATIFQNPSLVTAGTFQQISDNSSIFFGKFDGLGQPVWGTHVGLDGAQIGSGSFIDLGIEADESNKVYLFGGTKCVNNIATSDSFLFPNPSSDYGAGFVMKFNQEGQRLWGTYFGGSLKTYITSLQVKGNSFSILGITTCEDNIATQGSLQTNYLPTIPPLVPHNYFLAYFEPNRLSTFDLTLDNISISPNPSNGVLKISNLGKKGTISIYDVLGKLVHEQSIVESQTITISNVSKGIYFAKIKTGDTIYSEKILVE